MARLGMLILIFILGAGGLPAAATHRVLAAPAAAAPQPLTGLLPLEQSACPAWQAPPAASYQGFPAAGLYTFFDWRHLDPEVYPWLKGGHLVFPWRMIERDGPGQYRWDAVDQASDESFLASDPPATY